MSTDQWTGSMHHIKLWPFNWRSTTQILWSEELFYVLISIVKREMDDQDLIKSKGY
jgi:hypothetical protein